MDITEAFRTEDLSKADFFDFVVTPDNNDNQFQKQMRTVNAFLNSNGTGDDEKETNNNNMPISNEMANSIPTSQSDGNFDLNFWGDKDTVRLETAILEDLNKYCWNADDDVITSNGGGITQGNIKNTIIHNNNNNNNNNSNNNNATDGGHIYTLTVLNGIDQGATWYRPPLTTIIKDEDASVSSPNSMEHLQPGIDIDSILNIMPAQMNAFNNTYQENAINQTTDGMIKSETYTYEDSGFADNKDELANSLIIDTPLLETHDGYNNNNNNNNNNTNNNNNDWKLTNNNNNNNTTATTNGTADSLLRSALQGKAFVRYNGVSSKKENNAELRRALSTPPTKTETIFLKQDENDKIPTIVAGIDANGTVIFEEQIQAANQQTRTNDADNPTSTHHHMDDILLSQLDQHYPDDFEKLKRIANEVAESVNQFCQIDTSGVETVYTIAPDQIGLLNSMHHSPLSIASAAPPPVVTSTKPTAKKYKRSNSAGNAPGAAAAAGATAAKQSTTVQNATSTSNGVRKERSLHYCSICSKGFKDKYSVNVHIRTHTGEKPFACSLCGKSFRQKAHLAKHYQTHIAQKNAAAAGNVNTSKTKTR